jgi:glycosyltransferase involved in cell wall biosynthesis
MSHGEDTPEVEPLAPGKTLGIVTGKLYYEHGGRYYTTGGINSYVLGLAAHFRRTVLAVPVKPADRVDHLSHLPEGPVRVFPLPAWTHRGAAVLAAWPVVKRRLREALAGCDIVNPRLYMMVSMAAISALRPAGVPLFLSLTGDFSGLRPKGPLRFLSPRYWAIPWVSRALRENFTFVHGAHLAEMYALRPGGYAPTYSSTFHGGDIAPRACHPPPPGQPIRLVFLGRLSEGKALDTLLRAMADVAKGGLEFALDVMGSGPMRQGWERLSQDLGLRNVVFHGNVPQGPRWRELTGEANALVLTSLAEGAPKVVVEALRCALPVLSTRVGAVPSVIREGVNGWLVEPGSVEQFAAALKGMAALSGQQWVGISEANRALAAKYTIEEVSREMVEVLIAKGLLSEGHR